MFLSATVSLIAAAAALPHQANNSAAAAAAAPRCAFHGEYEGSEDASLWRDGIAFISTGLFPSPTQGGLMLAVDLDLDTIELVELELRGMPEGFGFRPHGMYIHNATQRLFVISHSDLLEEESIVVFDIILDSGARFPSLVYRFALISEEWPWYPAENIWWLNDLGVVAANELYVTQFGPQGMPLIPKHLWHATWEEEEVRPDGRLVVRTRIVADGAASLGLNGMNVGAAHESRPPTMLWANDLFLSRLWVFQLVQGELVRLENMELPGIVDNVEFDAESGDLTMGLCCGSGNGAIVAPRAEDPEVYFEQDTGRPYAVSTSLRYRQWLLLGSPGDTGLVVCDMDAANAA